MLRGSLEEFTLSDIFRLLSFTKKTGRLDVERAAGHGTVYFKDGDVHFAESTLTREPLGQKLIRAAVLTERELSSALDEHAQTGKRVGEVLIARGAIEQSQLEESIKSQVRDVTFELLRWDRGEFGFEALDEAVAEVPVALTVDHILLEASRRLEELETISKKIPSGETVLRVAPAPPEGAHQISITPQEWRLLVTIDGRRNVQQIAAAVKVDEFTAMRILYGLADAGLVEVVPQHVAVEMPAEAVTSPSTAEEPGAPVTDAVADPDFATASEPTRETEDVPEPVADAAVADESTEIGDVPEGDGDTFVLDVESLDASSSYGDILDVPNAEAEAVDAPEYEEAEPSNEDAEPVETTGSEEAVPFDVPERERAEVSAGASAEPIFAEPEMPDGVASDAREPGATGDEEPAAFDDVSEVAFELSEVAAASFSSEDDSVETIAPAATAEAAPTGDGGEDEGDLLGSFLDDEEPDAESALPGDPEREPPAPPRRPGGKIDRSMWEPVPPLDRAAVVRELASLFSDEPMRGATSSDDATAEHYQTETPEASPPKRVEDDEQLSKGLIHRLIDGVKGL